MSVEKQVDRLAELRRHIDEIKEQRTRLLGQREIHAKRLGEIEQRCRDEFDVDVYSLGDVIENLGEEADDLLNEAERMLGILEDGREEVPF